MLKVLHRLAMRRAIQIRPQLMFACAPMKSNRRTFLHRGDRLAYGERNGGVTIMDLVHHVACCKLLCGSDADHVAFSPDDSLLASGHDDSIIRLWDVAAGRMNSELVGHQRAVCGLSFSPDGRTLISAAEDGTARCWSVAHGRAYGVFSRNVETGLSNNACRVSLSADGQFLAVGHRRSKNDGPDVLLWKLDIGAKN